MPYDIWNVANNTNESRNSAKNATRDFVSLLDFELVSCADGQVLT